MTQNVAVQFLITTPPITRVLVSLIVFTTLLVYLNLLQPHQLTYSRFYIPKLQLHRIATTFLYFGRPSIEIALHIIFLYRYSLMLENSFIKTSDYFYMLLVIFILLFVLSNIYYIPLLGPSLSCTITYIWTRKNPQTVVQIMGFVSFYAFYLPFIVPMFTLVFEGKVSMEEIVGIIVGHIVYYLQDVYPRFGSTVLKTPCWCHRLFNERGACCSARRPGVRKIRDFPQAARSQPDAATPVQHEAEEKGGPAMDVAPTSGGAVQIGSAVAAPSAAGNEAVANPHSTTLDDGQKGSTEYAEFDWDSVEEVAAADSAENHRNEAIHNEIEAAVPDEHAGLADGAGSARPDNAAGLDGGPEAGATGRAGEAHSEDESDFEVIELSEEEKTAASERQPQTAEDELWVEASSEGKWGSEEIN